jgi:hypothetical protein
LFFGGGSVEQHVKTVLDWVKLQRSLSDYQNALRSASISVADVNPYTSFVENRITSFLKSYDKIEKDWDNIVFLEVLSKQTATEVIAMFIRFY